LVDALRDAGHDAVHVGGVTSLAAPDWEILELAAANGRVIVSADTDFGDLLSHRAATAPSVILFRRQTRRRASEQAILLLTHLPTVDQDLGQGAVVVIEETRVRVRRLPIGGGEKT
jgi:predicted nuclease of predicted toxin-antitoxin system